MHEAYMFEISLPKQKLFRSEKFSSYKRFVIECGKKCRELHAHADDVKILCITESGDVFARSPEHGELAV